MNIKLIILGNCGVGKSNLLLRYIKNKYSESLKSTLGIEFYTKKIIENGCKIKLNIWDTAGQEKFQSISNLYFKGVDSILLVYDISNIESFASLENWIKIINNKCDSNYILTIIGNKSDLDEFRKIEVEDGIKISKKYNCLFFEVSAKENFNIINLFSNIINEILKIKLINNNDSLMNFSMDNNIILEKKNIDLKQNIKKCTC